MDSMSIPVAARILDIALDRLVVPGYTRIGPALRHWWWPADPPVAALAGRHVLVTGATSGIGRAIAAGLLELGAVVHALGRSADRTDRLVAALRTRYPGAEVIAEVLDVGDLAAVRDWAADFTRRVPVLHAVVHNAGVLPAERSETAQGHELTLAVHVLGPHLLTALLTGPLTAARGSSVVFMSSAGMYGASLQVDDREYARPPYSGLQAYARTKRMQVVLAGSWAERLADRDIRVTSTHPGWVDTEGVSSSIPGFGRLMKPLLRTPTEGADTTVWLVATRPRSEPGHFWHDRAQRPTTWGWERGQQPGTVEKFLDAVAADTGVPRDRAADRLL